MSTVEGPVTYVTRGAPHYSAGVTIRAKAQSTGIGEDLRFNPEYFLTISGILKIIEVVCVMIFSQMFVSNAFSLQIFAIVALSCISPPLLVNLFPKPLQYFELQIENAIYSVTFFCSGSQDYSLFSWQSHSLSQ